MIRICIPLEHTEMLQESPDYPKLLGLAPRLSIDKQLTQEKYLVISPLLKFLDLPLGGGGGEVAVKYLSTAVTLV